MKINKNLKYLMFFDLDDTVLFKGTVYPEVREALGNVKKAGHGIILNTGRSRAFLPEIAYTLDWDGMVCASSYIEYGGRVIMNDCISPELLLITAEYCDKTALPLRFEGVGHVLTTVKNTPYTDISEKYREVLPFTDDISVATIGCPIGYEDRKFFEKYYDVIVMPKYTELLQKGKTKADGIRIISEKLGIPRSRTVAFGDSLNDSAMLEYAGISIIMGKAPEELDEIADIRASENETGTAEVINRYFL